MRHPTARPLVLGAVSRSHDILPLSPEVQAGPARCARIHHCPHCDYGDLGGGAWVDDAPTTSAQAQPGETLALWDTRDRQRTPPSGWAGVIDAFALWDSSIHPSVQHASWISLLRPQCHRLAQQAPRPDEVFGPDTLALVTRDALGWFALPHEAPFLREGAELAAFGPVAEGTYWPMLWLRPVVSAHDTLERLGRLRADLAFALHALPALFLPDGLLPEPLCA